MLSTQSLREQMDRYADGSLSSESLEEWLVSESWDMRRWAPIGLQRMVEEMMATFVSHSDGQLSADDLDAFLKGRITQLHRAAKATPVRDRVDPRMKAVPVSPSQAVTESVVVEIPAFA